MSIVASVILYPLSQTNQPQGRTRHLVAMMEEYLQSAPPDFSVAIYLVLWALFCGALAFIAYEKYFKKMIS